jgi:hypothetical protein
MFLFTFNHWFVSMRALALMYAIVLVSGCRREPEQQPPAQVAQPPEARKMRAFWNDGGRGPKSDTPREVSLKEALLIWSDIRGVKGNFLGLFDDQGRTIQFYFDDGIPDQVEDAVHLRIVLLDFPQPKKKGSYTALVTIGEVHGLIEKAFNDGADYRKFEGVSFTPW